MPSRRPDPAAYEHRGRVTADVLTRQRPDRPKPRKRTPARPEARVGKNLLVPTERARKADRLGGVGAAAFTALMLRLPEPREGAEGHLRSPNPSSVSETQPRI